MCRRGLEKFARLGFEQGHHLIDLDVTFVLGAFVGRECSFVTFIGQLFDPCDDGFVRLQVNEFLGDLRSLAGAKRLQ